MIDRIHPHNVSFHKTNYFRKNLIFLQNSLTIKIRLVKNNIFIAFLKKTLNGTLLLQQYNLNKNKLFKNKLLAISFLLPELIKLSLVEFFMKYSRYRDYNLIIQIYSGSQITSPLLTNLILFSEFNIISTEIFCCRPHNGCRQKKLQRKKTFTLLL